jgi:sulfite reductase (NADPH) hemoprotein beta-component
VAEIVPMLGAMFRQYAKERLAGESFGDFAIRAGFVTPTYTPQDFHEKKGAATAA